MADILKGPDSRRARVCPYMRFSRIYGQTLAKEAPVEYTLSEARRRTETQRAPHPSRFRRASRSLISTPC